MTRTVKGLCAAMSLAFAASLSAQAPATPQSSTTDRDRQSTTTDRQSTTTTAGEARSAAADRDAIRVTGCVAKTPSGYDLTNVTAVSPAAPAATTTSESARASATGALPNSIAYATMFKLQRGDDLDKHVGHKVEITGRASESSAAAPTSGAATTTGEPNRATGTVGGSTTDTARAAAPASPQLDVQSLKMIAAACP
jgi:hypothetical protein